MTSDLLGEAMLPIFPDDTNRLHDTTYCVKGFRSLQDFVIRLEPGLNLLLGSNGSGKTNFIEFLDFLTTLITRGGAAAVSRAGGIARVFSQESLKRKIPRVTAKVTGAADLGSFARIRSKKTHFKFEYEVDIRYSKFHTAIYIANERIKFKNLHDPLDCFDSDTTVGSVEIHRRNPLIDEEPRWTVGTYLVSNSPRNPLRYPNLARAQAVTGQIGLKSNKSVNRQVLETPAVGADESIFGSRWNPPAFEAVKWALSRGRSFNLIPHRARTPDDISRTPVIEPDGSGLSATIYHMQQARKAESRQSIVRTRRFAKDSLDTIISWTQLVLPELQDITATADPHTGKYLVYLIVGNEDQSLRIPLQSASDGTLKWLSFVCLIVAHGTSYTFEEPENYLHPKMQQFLVSLIREAIETEEIPGPFILSTHSETIINQCRPNELILFKFENGETTCERLKNPEAVIKQVNETGFGLGHYYASNVLS